MRAVVYPLCYIIKSCKEAACYQKKVSYTNNNNNTKVSERLSQLEQKERQLMAAMPRQFWYLLKCRPETLDTAVRMYGICGLVCLFISCVRL